MDIVYKLFTEVVERKVGLMEFRDLEVIILVWDGVVYIGIRSIKC